MSTIEVVRGGIVASRHQVHVAVVDGSGTILGSVGDANRYTYYRSAAKPIQALPLVEEGVLDAFGLTSEELSLCCASHEGEDVHVDCARSILSKVGADESLLRCGAQIPFSPEAARKLSEAKEQPSRIHNNCSGKHAGMIALAIAMGWDPIDYHRADHPVQQRMLEEVIRFSEVSAGRVATGVDGCGVLCFAVPLRDMARSFAGFAVQSDRGDAAHRIVDAMTSAPFMVGGTGRTCTEVMEIAGDRVFVKLGAEGVYVAGLRRLGLGVAIKVEDGGRRAVEAALVHTLQSLGVITDGESHSLRRHGRPILRNTRNEIVGQLRPSFDLTMAGLGPSG